MKKIYLLLFILAGAFITNAQTTLYSTDFTSGSTGWSLDDDQILDGWIVNSSYNCTPATPNRNGGNYLHIYNDLMTDVCAIAYFGGGSSTTVDATMTTNINTTGYNNLSLTFWWMAGGGSASYGSAWYSPDGGSTWKQFTTRSKYNSQTSWKQETITINSSNFADALNKTNLKLRFRWVNGATGSSNLGFSIDDILLTGGGTACSNIGGTATATLSAMCSGLSTSINLTGSTGTIQWQESANGTSGWANVTTGSGATTATYTTGTLSATTYYRAVLSEASCPDQYSSTTSVTIEPSTTPTISIAASPAGPICAGTAITFTPTATGQGSFPIYQWKVNSTNTATGATYSPTTLKTNDTVTCQLISSNACSNPTSALSTGIVMTVNPKPAATFTFIADTLISVLAVSYQWYLNDNIINGATNQTHIARTSGNYSEKDTDGNGCSITSSSKYFLVTGITSLNEESVSVYPNPSATGNWLLTVGKDLVGTTYEIYDMQGRTVVRSEIKSEKTNIDTEPAKGIYLLRIIYKGETITRKLVRS